LKLTAFLTGLHAFVDQSAPGMTVWEPIKHNELSYVKISPTAQAKADTKELKNTSIYYSTAGGALLITPSEVLMKRALDRQADRAAAATQPAKAVAAGAPWLGDNYCAQIDVPGVMKALAGVIDRLYGSEMQRRAWSNLPILNEWKARFPTLDPVQLHERLWQTRLIDPAGGGYVWNETLRTMESTLYGCPEAPKPGPAIPPALQGVRWANFGVSFENQGLRARAELLREDHDAPAKAN
jgi:hypothetical protein